MNVININKVKENGLEKDIFEITMIDEKGYQIKNRISSNTLIFKDMLDNYEKYLQLTYDEIMNNIKPFFENNEKGIKRMGTVSFFIIMILMSFLTLIPEETAVFTFMALMIPCFLSFTAMAYKIDYTKENIKKYVSDEELKKLYVEFSKKLSWVRKLQKEYAFVFNKIIEDEQREKLEEKRIEKEHEEQIRINHRKEKDYLDYLKLPYSERKKYYPERRRRPVLNEEPPLPDFLIERNNNYREFARREFEPKRDVFMTSVNPKKIEKLVSYSVQPSSSLKMIIQDEQIDRVIKK